MAELGSCLGTYSRVYKVRRDDGQVFACKRQMWSFVGLEMEILTNVAHASQFMLDIVALGFNFEGGPHGMCSIVMPLVEEPLPWNELATMKLKMFKSYAKSLFGALSDLHQHGYVHRDVKPSNFLCTSLDPIRCCLIDFGLAQEVRCVPL